MLVPIPGHVGCAPGTPSSARADPRREARREPSRSQSSASRASGADGALEPSPPRPTASGIKASARRRPHQSLQPGGVCPELLSLTIRFSPPRLQPARSSRRRRPEHPPSLAEAQQHRRRHRCIDGVAAVLQDPGTPRRPRKDAEARAHSALLHRPASGSGPWTPRIRVTMRQLNCRGRFRQWAFGRVCQCRRARSLLAP